MEKKSKVEQVFIFVMILSAIFVLLIAAGCSGKGDGCVTTYDVGDNSMTLCTDGCSGSEVGCGIVDDLPNFLCTSKGCIGGCYTFIIGDSNKELGISTGYGCCGSSFIVFDCHDSSCTLTGCGGCTIGE